MLTYIYAIIDLPVEKIVLLLNKLPDEIKPEAMSSYDMIIEKGIEKGRRQGRKEITLNAIHKMKNEGFENEVPLHRPGSVRLRR